MFDSANDTPDIIDFDIINGWSILIPTTIF